MKSQDTTYFEKLTVSWMLFWRGTLMGFALAFIWGHLVGILFGPLLPPQHVQAINSFGGYLLSVILVGPTLIYMLLRKRFQGFRVEFVRTAQGNR